METLSRQLFTAKVMQEFFRHEHIPTDRYESAQLAIRACFEKLPQEFDIGGENGGRNKEDRDKRRDYDRRDQRPRRHSDRPRDRQRSRERRDDLPKVEKRRREEENSQMKSVAHRVSKTDQHKPEGTMRTLDKETELSFE